MASPLFALPTETLLQITSYLTTPELGHVRLSCRWMERKLFDFFAKEFFSVRQVMFSEISLRALVAISEHSQLALYVKKVIVGLDTIQSWNSGYITSSTTPSLVDYKKLKAQDEWLKKSGEDRVLLASALQKFRNCRNIGMRDFYSQRQRSRDATAWKSWGVNTLLKSHQFSTAQPRGYDATQALTVILRASAQSDVKIESIEMITRSSHANYDTAFYVPESLQTDYARTFQHLKVLMLCINNTRGPDDGTYDVVEHLGNFLGFAPNLRHLRLNGSPPGLVGDIQHRGTNQKGRWVDLFAMLATVLAQSKLERLEFGTSTLPGPETTHLFKVLSSLEHLTLYRIRLVTPGAEYAIFKSLESLSCLKSLTIDNLRLIEDPIVFKLTPETALPWNCRREPDMKAYFVTAYEGPDMKDHISNLQERMVVLTEKVKRALVREEFGDSADSADSMMAIDEDDSGSESESDY